MCLLPIAERLDRVKIQHAMTAALASWTVLDSTGWVKVGSVVNGEVVRKQSLANHAKVGTLLHPRRRRQTSSC